MTGCPELAHCVKPALRLPEPLAICYCVRRSRVHRRNVDHERAWLTWIIKAATGREDSRPLFEVLLLPGEHCDAYLDILCDGLCACRDICIVYEWSKRRSAQWG